MFNKEKKINNRKNVSTYIHVVEKNYKIDILNLLHCLNCLFDLLLDLFIST